MPIRIESRWFFLLTMERRVKRTTGALSRDGTCEFDAAQRVLGTKAAGIPFYAHYI